MDLKRNRHVTITNGKAKTVPKTEGNCEHKYPQNDTLLNSRSRVWIAKTLSLRSATSWL